MPRTARLDKNLVPGFPERPKSLTEGAAAQWDRLAGEITEAGIALSPAHRATLELAATIADDMKEARAVVLKDGAYISSKTGLIQHPAARRLDALRRDYFKVLTMLGIRAAVATLG